MNSHTPQQKLDLALAGQQGVQGLGTEPPSPPC